MSKELEQKSTTAYVELQHVIKSARRAQHAAEVGTDTFSVAASAYLDVVEAADKLGLAMKELADAMHDRDANQQKNAPAKAPAVKPAPPAAPAVLPDVVE